MTPIEFIKVFFYKSTIIYLIILKTHILLIFLKNPKKIDDSSDIPQKNLQISTIFLKYPLFYF